MTKFILGEKEMDDMKTSKIWMMAIIVFCLLNSPSFAKSVVLKLKFTPGDSTVYKLTEETERTLDLKIDGNSESNKTKKTIEITFRQEIESVDRKGNASAKITIEKLKYSSVSRNKVGIDFDSSRKKDLLEPMAKLIGQSYSIMISPKGEVVKVIEADKIREITKSAKVSKVHKYPSKSNTTGKTEYEYRVVESSFTDNKALTWFIGHDDFIKELHESLLLPGNQKLKIGKSWDATKKLSIPPDSSEKIYILQKVENENNHQVAIAEMNNVNPPNNGIGEMPPLTKKVSLKGYLKIDLDEGKIIKFKEEFISEGGHSSSVPGKAGNLSLREIRINTLEKVIKNK